MFLAVIYGLSSGLLLSLTYLFFRKSFADSHPAVGFFLQASFGVLLWIPFTLIGGVTSTGIIAVFPMAVISAILSEALVIYTSSKGEFAVTGAILASYPVYTILFAAVLLGEHLSFVQSLFIALTIIGSILASFPEKLSELRLQMRDVKSPFVILSLAIITVIAVGFADAIVKPAIDTHGAFSFLFALALAQPIIAGLFVFAVKEQRAVKELVTYPKKHRMAILAGVFSATSLIFFWLTFSETLASIASPLTGTTAIFISIWAFVFYREKFHVWKIIGITSVVIGVIGVSLF